MQRYHQPLRIITSSVVGLVVTGKNPVCCMFYSPTDKTALLHMFHQHNLIEKANKAPQLSDNFIGRSLFNVDTKIL